MDNYPQITPRTTGDCSECEPLQKITDKVDSLIACAEKKKEDQEAGAEGEEAAAEEGEAEVVEAECPADHTMYVMALITINEDIDKEVENLYNRIIATTEDEERTKFKEDLQDMKEVREQVEILITKVINLNSEEDLEKLKKAVKRGLAGSSSKLNNKLTTCKGSCQGPGKSVKLKTILHFYLGYIHHLDICLDR